MLVTDIVIAETYSLRLGCYLDGYPCRTAVTKVWMLTFEQVVSHHLDVPAREAGRSLSRAKRALGPVYYRGRMAP